MFDVDQVRLAGSEHRLPRMLPVRQRFAAGSVPDVQTALADQVAAHDRANPLSGKRIAVAVGSRGVARIDEVTAELVAALVARGAKPFVVPAMGSHGGGTADGQRQVLADYGVTEESVRAPVVSSMDTVVIAHLPDGTPVHFDAEAAAADGVVVVNRVKPHTDFKGEHESGLAKMLAIGLGKHEGATTLHSHGFGAFPHLIPAAAQAALDNAPVEFGVAVVENAYEDIAELELVPAQGMLEREAELLVRAKQLLPRLLFPRIDVLVVDEIGKDISGAGMDPNITGRAPVTGDGFADVAISQIVVLGLTERTHGNACGLGIADVTTQRCLDGIDFGSFYTNSLTSGVAVSAKIPMALADDRQAIIAALHMARGTGRAPRVVRMRNTLSLIELEVSEALADEVADHPDLSATGPPVHWDFDAATGRLLPAAAG
ncbi:hypothetical protein IQ251_12220 [Saccharopolyspora sp. HNM0983]|uniref:LarA-like N-terminal domain-containing protein n=1 Tax=Saccharopolyspora montiporae TaxID=2781240 RepID=A0A929B8H8_9PSEU|nr:lactate racemase domain-containing protein [Saccharopolyspora sp. HNM0983]MBE9375209.1 hypothetical protein [Saccharopolyspora sp. HNM0983]